MSGTGVVSTPAATVRLTVLPAGRTVPTGWSWVKDRPDRLVGRHAGRSEDDALLVGDTLGVGDQLADEVRDDDRHRGLGRSRAATAGRHLEDEEGDQRQQDHGADPGDPDDRAGLAGLLGGMIGGSPPPGGGGAPAVPASSAEA